MFNFIFALQRKHTLSVLKKHSKCFISNDLKLGVGNHFVVYQDSGKCHIGKKVSLRNYVHIFVTQSAELSIGDHVFMNNNCSVNCMKRIEIGNNTIFGEM